MQKLLQLTVLTFVIPLFSYAQNNFKPGYIINLKNDTVNGFIDYKEWRNNPKSFGFKTYLNDKTQKKFTTDDVKGFGIKNLEYYKRAIVHLDNGSIDIATLSTKIDTSFTIDTVFLKIVSTGAKIALYNLTDETKTRFYVEDKDNKNIIELNYYMYMQNSAVQTVNSFRNQLATFAVNYKPDNRNLFERIEKAEYSEAEIKEIVKVINNGENQQFKTDGVSKVNLFLGAGAKHSKLIFNGSSGPFPDGTNKSNTVPTISGGIDFVANKNTQKIIFRLELSLSNNSYNIYNSTPGNLTASTALNLKQFNAVVMPQIIYNFYSTKKLKIFLDAGIAFNLSFYNNYNYVSTYFDQTSTVQNKYPQFNKGWASFPLKAGVFINEKIEVYAGYYFSSSVISSTNYGADISSEQIGVNYIF